MRSALASRIAVLGAKSPKPERRVVRVVSGEGQETEVRLLLQSKGLDPDADDLFIIHNCIVSPAGEEPYSEEPYILGVTGQQTGPPGSLAERPTRRATHAILTPATQHKPER